MIFFRFGRAGEDFTDILAPLYQCCLVRASTVRTLLNYYYGPKKLSETLRESLSSDPISPILAEKQLAAVDRRLEIILRTILRCVEKAGNPSEVIRTWYEHPDPKEESPEEESD